MSTYCQVAICENFADSGSYCAQHQDGELLSAPHSLSYVKAIIGHLLAKNTSQESIIRELDEYAKHLRKIVLDSDMYIRCCSHCGWVDYGDAIWDCHPGSGILVCKRCVCDCSDGNECEENEGEENESDENEDNTHT